MTTLPLLLACLTSPAPETETVAEADTAEEVLDSGGACEGEPVVAYNNFGHGFLLTYCQGCHAGSAPERYGAPEAVTFDSVEEAWSWSDRILARTVEAGGMPPAGGVSAEELLLLESWLTCGAPGT
jgi:uncharacterized membrane protein